MTKNRDTIVRVVAYPENKVLQIKRRLDLLQTPELKVGMRRLSCRTKTSGN